MSKQKKQTTEAAVHEIRRRTRRTRPKSSWRRWPFPEMSALLFTGVGRTLLGLDPGRSKTIMAPCEKARRGEILNELVEFIGE